MYACITYLNQVCKKRLVTIATECIFVIISKYSKLIFGLISKNFGYGGNGEAYQAPTSTRPLGITRSVPGLCGYQAKD